MNLPASSVLPLLLAASLLPAQGNFLTSPSSLASTDGNQSLAFSEGTGTRWQQIHGDLTGPARSLLGLRLRRDELVPALPTATSRQITIEVLVGETDLTLVGSDFAANFLTPAQQVVPPTLITLPDWSVPGASPLPRAAVARKWSRSCHGRSPPRLSCTYASCTSAVACSVCHGRSRRR